MAGGTLQAVLGKLSTDMSDGMIWPENLRLSQADRINNHTLTFEARIWHGCCAWGFEGWD